MNVAVWESSRALGEAFRSPEFQERASRYPDSAVAAPHVFERVAVPGIFPWGLKLGRRSADERGGRAVAARS